MANPSDIERDAGLNRRTILSGIGVTAAAVATATVPAAPASAAETFWSKDYVAMKGDVRIQLYRRRLKAPVAGQAPLPTQIGRAHV